MTTNEQARQAILQQAGFWYTTHRSGPLSHAQRAEFLAWLKISPLHIEEYFGVVAAARLLAAGAREIDEDVVELAATDTQQLGNVVGLPDNGIPHQPRRAADGRRWLVSAMAACVAFLTLGIVTFAFRDVLRYGPGETFRTVHGQQGSWRLADGSVLHLNTRSAATVRFSDAERVVKVHYGQAMFQVAHQPARRFRVAVGQANIVAIGTQFDVYRDGEATQVTILDGRVAVTRNTVPPLGAAPLQTRGAVALSTGQQLEIRPGRPSQPRTVDVSQVSAWLQRQIIFEATPLAEIVAQFNRYASVPLEIADPSLRNLRISGVFNAYDIESFLEFMRRLDSVTVEETPTLIRFHRRAAQPLTTTVQQTPL